MTRKRSKRSEPAWSPKAEWGDGPWKDASGQTHGNVVPAGLPAIATQPITTLRVSRPALDMFPALAPASIPDFQARPVTPRREPDEALFTHIEKTGLWVLLCGLCKQNGRPQARHTDRDAQRQIPMFGALRASARAAGWRTDADGAWACEDCQATPAYRTPAAESARAWSANAADARLCGDTSGEYWHIIAAGERLAERGRHARPGAVLIRPDGRFVAAWLVRGEPARDTQPGRHRAVTA